MAGAVLITGANGGLGTAVVSQILKTSKLADQYHAIYAVRKVESATALQAALQGAPESHKHETIALDLGLLASVREVARDINDRVASSKLPRIRVLILNAGYQEYTTQTFSKDGFDMAFQVNYLSHWLLTLMLLQSMDKENGRIVVVGSWSHDPFDSRNNSMGLYRGKWKTDIFKDTESLAKGIYSSPKEDSTLVGGFRRYGAAKLCEVMMIHELQARLSKDPELSNISVLGMDPGGMPTPISRRSNWFIRVLVARFILPVLASIMGSIQPNGTMRPTSKSAGDLVRASFDTETLGQHPKDVYLNGSEISKTSPESQDPAKREMLWRDSIGYAQLKEGETVLSNWK